VRIFLLPLWEKVARTKSVPDEGFAQPIDRAPSSGPNFATLIRATFSHKGRRQGRTHTDAVVTPPSTTMVWPVMKLDASEPR
jgi:hypothetical protein